MQFNKKYYVKLKRIFKYSDTHGLPNRFWVNGDSVYYTDSIGESSNFRICFMFFKEPCFKFAAAMEADKILSDDLRSETIENILENKVKVYENFPKFSEFEINKIVNRSKQGYSKSFYNGIEFPTDVLYYLFDLFDIKNIKKNCVCDLDEKNKIITFGTPVGIFMVKSNN